MNRDAPVRVAVVHHYAALYGSEQSMLVMLRHLDRSAFTPELILTQAGPLVDAAGNAGIDAHVLPWLLGMRSKRVRERVQTVVRFGQWLRKRRFGIVHLNMWENGDGGAHLVAARMAGAGYMLGIRCRMDDHLTRRDQFWLSRTRRVVSVSRDAVQPIFARRRLDRFWHVRPEQVAVIPPGRDLEQLRRTPAASDAAIEALGLRPDRPIVGAVAAITPNKRPDLFLQAAACVAASHPEVQFILVGGVYVAGAPGAREYVDHIKALAAELGLGDRTVFAGFRSDAIALMRRFSVLAVTSAAEGFSGVTIEAMALGLPVVAAAVGGIPDALPDLRLGTVIGTSDPQHFAAAIRHYLDQPERTDYARDPSLAAAVNRYDAGTTTRQFEAEYRALLDV